MEPSRLSTLSLALVPLCIAGLLWSCSSDDPAAPSDPPAEDASPPPSVDSGALDDASAAPDASEPDADAGSLDELIATYLAAVNRQSAACFPNSVPIAVDDPRAREYLVGYLSAPGTTDAFRQGVRACVLTLDASCSGTSQACYDARSAPGTLADGSICALGQQCASGVCTAQSEAACGACVPALGAGVDCSAGKERLCARGTACVQDGSNTICSPTALVGEGATCDSQRFLCKSGLACVQNGAASTCMHEAASGGICKTGAFALPCAKAGTEACNGTTNLCAPLPTLGQACPVGSCAAGVVCDPATFTCRPPAVGVPVGSLCSSNSDQCVAGASCSVYSSAQAGFVCATDSPLNGPCGNTGVPGCESDLTCAPDSTCKAKVKCP